MGLFKKRQDDFTLIADNVLAFYLIMRENYASAFDTDQLLFGACMMDIFAYLQNGTLTPRDAGRAVYFGKRGELSVGGKKMVHVDLPEGGDAADYAPDEKELVINVIMQLECVIMSVAKRRTDPLRILAVVDSKKDLIRETVSKGLEEGKNHKFYAALEDQVKLWMEEKTFNNMVAGFKL